MFRLQNELLDTWRDHRAALARRARLAAVRRAVLDTVGLADPGRPRRRHRVERTGLIRTWTAWMCCCSSSPPRWFRSRACSPRRTRQSRWSPRRGWRRWPGRAARRRRRCTRSPRTDPVHQPAAVAADSRGDHRDRHGGEGGAEHLGFQFWVGVALVAIVMVVISYVAIGVLPRTLGRQHPTRWDSRSPGRPGRWPRCSHRSPRC